MTIFSLKSKCMNDTAAWRGKSWGEKRPLGEVPCKSDPRQGFPLNSLSSVSVCGSSVPCPVGKRALFLRGSPSPFANGPNVSNLHGERAIPEGSLEDLQILKLEGSC